MIDRRALPEDFNPNVERSDGPDIQIYQAVGRREEQQDRYLVTQLNDGVLVMVADGHSGSNTVELIVQQTVAIYSQERAVEKKRIKGMEFYGLAPKNERAIIRRTMQQLEKMTRHMLDGSTLTLGFIQCGVRHQRRKVVVRAHVGQIGDSLFALSSMPGRVAMTSSHSVTHHQKDVERIMVEYQRLNSEPCKRDRHYLYTRSPNYGLSLTRALGDRNDLLIRKSEVRSYEAELNHAVVLFATDGLLQVDQPVKPQINRVLQQIRTGKTVKMLGEEMEQKMDNVTLISVRYPPSPIYLKD
jgi:serine/threonine protein phosphatase PrpC